MKIIKISINRREYTATIRNGERSGEIIAHQSTRAEIEDWARVYDGYSPAIAGLDEKWTVINI